MKHGTFWKYSYDEEWRHESLYVCSKSFNTKYIHPYNLPFLFVLTDQILHYYTFLCLKAILCYLYALPWDGNRQRFWGTKHNWVNVVNDSCPFQFLCQNFFLSITDWWFDNEFPIRYTAFFQVFSIYIRHQTHGFNWLTLKLMDTPYTSFVQKCITF